MKKTKVIIPALAVLLLSTAASVTGTVAWFAMNSTVAATGMQIKVNSQNTYLLISSQNDTAGAIQTEGSTSVNYAMTDQESLVTPVHPVQNNEQAALIPASTGLTVGGTAIETGGAIVNSYETAAAVTNWYTAVAALPTASAMKVGSARQLTTFTGYVVIKTAYLTVAVGSNDVAELGVTGTFLPKGFSKSADTTAVSGDIYYSFDLVSGTFTKLSLDVGDPVPEGSYEITAASGLPTVDMKPYKAIVATDDGGFALLDSTKNNTRQSIEAVSNPHSITSSTVRTVKIYLYVDGEASSVYTNNIANLADAELELSFDASLAA